MARRLVDRRDEESGAIAVMASVIVLATLVATSLAVDVGRAGFASRDQQGVTDRAALDAAQVLRAASYGSLGDMHSAVELAIVDSLGRNPGTSTGIARDREIGLVEIGRIDATTQAFESICSANHDPATTPPCTTGVDHGFTPVDVTAVRVETGAFVPFTFAIGDADGGRDVVKQSVAETLALASIRVGSELAGLDAGLLNDMLEGILCTGYEATTAADVDAHGVVVTGSSGTRVDAPAASCDLGVSLVGYQGLAGAHVTLGELVDGLDLAAGSPTQALAADVTVAGLLSVMAASLDDQAGPTAVALNELATEIDQSLVVSVDELVGVRTGTVGQAAAAELNMFDLVRGSAQLVNGTNALALPDLGVAIPGLAGVDTDLSVIEGPRPGVGPPGVTTARTSQVDLDLDTALTLDLASEVLGILGPLSLGTLTVTADPVVLPVDVDVAQAVATLDAIQCGDPTDVTQAGTSTDVTTTTDVVDLSIGEDGQWTDVAEVRVQVRAPLLGTLLADAVLTVRARASVPLGGATSDTNTFWGPFASGPEHTSGGPADFGGLTGTALELDVMTGGSVGVLDTAMATLTAGISDAIELAALPVIAQLDDAVVQPVLDTLGVGMGNADTWTQSVDCRGRRLLPLGS